MKISEYVALLQNLQVEVGDLEVYVPDFQTTVMSAVKPARPPQVVELATMRPKDKYARVYTGGGPWNPREPSGIKVIRLV